jgi:hypothetical protein
MPIEPAGVERVSLFSQMLKAIMSKDLHWL